MRSRNVLWFLVVMTVAFAACQPADTFDAEVAKAEIEAVNAKFVEAVANQDADALAALYTEDALAMPPNHPLVRGSEAIGSYFSGGFDMGLQGLSLTTKEITGHGNMAHEIGVYIATIAMGDGETMEEEGTYMVVWHKGEDGQWRLHRDIWNSNSPMPDMGMEMSEKM